MALFLLISLPFVIVQSAYISINYRNNSNLIDTHIQVVSSVYNYWPKFEVEYYFSMSNPTIPITFNGKGKGQNCQNAMSACWVIEDMGVPVNVMLNPSSRSNYSFQIVQTTQFGDIQVISEGCYQKMDTNCRYVNFTNGQPSPIGFVCMCSGLENFCTIDPILMWKEPICADAPSPTDPIPVLTGFELSVFYGTTYSLSSYVMDISRRAKGGNVVSFDFTMASTLYYATVNGKLLQCSTTCDSVEIEVGDSLLITVMDNFTFTLKQTSLNQTDIEYGGCGDVVLNGTCKDTPSTVTDSYGCLCGGSTRVCSAPAIFNDSCFVTSSSSSQSTPITPSSSTSPSSIPSDWTLYVFYGEKSDQPPLKMEIIRTYFNPNSAYFNIYSMDGSEYDLDGTPMSTNTSKKLALLNRMDIIFLEGFHVYLFEYQTTTNVGIGDGSCPQNLTSYCKAGKSLDGYACLCLNTDNCSYSLPFDECPNHSTTSTDYPSSLPSPSSPSESLSTSSVPISTSSSSTTSTVTSTPTTSSPTTSSSTSLPTMPTTPTTTAIPTTDIPSLKNLSDSTIGQNNVTQVLNDTLSYSNSKDNLSPDQVDDISVILSKSANVENLNQTDSLLILTNLDNCLYVPYDSMNTTTASRLNSVFLPMVQNTNSTSIDYLAGTNIGFSSRQVNCSTYGSDQGIMDNLTMFVTINSSPDSKNNAIRIRESNFKDNSLSSVCAEEQTVSHVFFTMYRDRKLFIGPQTYRTYNNKVWEDNKDGRVAGPQDGNSRVKRDTSSAMRTPSPCDNQQSLAVDSPVMSGTLLSDGGSKVLSRLDSTNVVANLQFNIQGLLTPLHGKFVVTWWDNSSQVWATSDECTTEKKGDVVHATCPHLTDFTLIVAGSLDDPLVCDKALSITGYVANGLSIASLLFLFVVYFCAFFPLFADTKIIKFMNGYAVSKRDSVSLSYTTSLLLFYIVFTLFANQDVAGNACSAMAALAYALFIATIIMNIFKCLRMMSKFLPGRTRNFFNFLQRAVVFDTISIVFSFVTSLLLLLLSDFFNRNDTFCWVRLDYIVFATIIPVSILVVNAAITTALAAYRLCSTRLNVKRRGKHVDYNLGSKLLNIFILQFTLGMPWVLQYFTLALPQATAWHYVFTIVLGSQGTVLVILFFYKRQRILRSSRYARKLASQATQATTVSHGNSSSS